MSDPEPFETELPPLSALALYAVALFAGVVAALLGALFSPEPPPEAEGWERYKRRR